MHPKNVIHHDLEYLQWIREQPSIVSEAPPPSDPHHVWCTGRKGRRNDYCAVPLTREEHTLYHSMGHEWFETTFNKDLKDEIINLLSAYQEEKKNE